MYDFYYTDWQLDSYKGVNDPCMNWSDSPFLVSTNLGTLQSTIACSTFNHKEIIAQRTMDHYYPPKVVHSFCGKPIVS